MLSTAHRNLSFLLVTLFAVTAITPVFAEEPASFGTALTKGKISLNLRYRYEDVDQENIDKQLPHEASLKTEWREDLLGGIQVITGKWADGSPFLAIPYYARQNHRGDGAGNQRGVRSSVWIDEE